MWKHEPESKGPEQEKAFSEGDGPLSFVKTERLLYSLVTKDISKKILAP
jgi:hypothetical protein